MKISELCKMIEDSIHSGRYPLGQDTEKQMAGLVQIINRSSSDDLKDTDIKIEVRIKDLYVLNNYIQSIQHLPGVIEIDALDLTFLSNKEKYIIFVVVPAGHRTTTSYKCDIKILKLQIDSTGHNGIRHTI
jgi:hypothetical protein